MALVGLAGAYCGILIAVIQFPRCRAVTVQQIKGNKVGAERVVIKGSDAHPLGGSPSKEGGHAGGVAVFRAGLIKTTGLLCGGARCGTCSAPDCARSAAREKKAKNVASTMGL